MCYSENMSIAESKVTKQGQISVPVEIRKRLGVAPGSVLEWSEDPAGNITVRRAERYSSEDIHAALFDELPIPKTVEEMDAAIIKLKRARR